MKFFVIDGILFKIFEIYGIFWDLLDKCTRFFQVIYLFFQKKKNDVQTPHWHLKG